jgi:hypothetical protein
LMKTICRVSAAMAGACHAGARAASGTKKEHVVGLLRCAGP